ncbi:MAG: hypothetical protein KDA86_21155 [Planctomycetaceae bacterium]|nr:hypothetical protein [Planctomycetaceae bacterium]
MGRRRHSDEIVFGSDSFLDILANIVGILIILIVVAGMRVSKTPVTTSKSPRAPDKVSAAAIVPVPTLLPEAQPTPPTDVILDLIEPELPPEPPELSAELVRQVEELESTIEQLKAQRSRLVTEEQTLTGQAQQMRQSLSHSQEELEAERAALTRGSLAIAELDQKVEDTHRELATLQVMLAETKSAQPEATVLKHKLTPVARQVEDNEIHFLLTRGRVSYVPLNELAEELKSNIQRKKNQLLKSQQYTGVIGPVGGFKMEYLIERQASSLIDELRYGTAIIRMGVSQWRIIPQPDVVAETASQALHPHSRFIAALRRADRNATLTFWVHPDSFALHRDLQDFAHEQGFEVAARPLPAGIPITGSPQGSRSAAQ